MNPNHETETQLNFADGLWANIDLLIKRLGQLRQTGHLQESFAVSAEIDRCLAASIDLTAIGVRVTGLARRSAA